MTPRKRTKKVYRTVLALLRDPKRWGKGHMQSHGRYCLLGGIERVYDYSRKYQVKARLRAAINAHRRNKGTHVKSPDIITFNDHWTTTHADILAVLRAARI